MTADIPCFAAVVIPPGQPQKVTVPDDSFWTIGSVSIIPSDDLPATGRVVVYAATVKPDGTESERIAIAPLRVGAAEVATLDLQIAPAGPIIFSTAGAPISVTVTGYTATSDPLLVEPLQPGS
jgi:hypothetical protein